MAKNDRLTLDLYLDMETVSEPQLSPDGSADRLHARLGRQDERQARVGALDHERRRQPQPLPHQGLGARWSPTGDRIAFTTQGEPKGSQIFVRWMDAEGATSQVTRVEQTPSAVAWSPDGTQLSFSMLVEERNTWPIKMPKAPAGAKWTEAPRIVERLNYRRDRTGFTDNGYRHIFVVPAIGGTPRQITSGNFDHTGSEWTPDGRSILFSGLRSENAELPVARVGDLRGRRGGRRDPSAHDAQGTRRQPVGLARRQARRLHRLRLDDATRGSTARST